MRRVPAVCMLIATAYAVGLVGTLRILEHLEPRLLALFWKQQHSAHHITGRKTP